MSKLRIRGKVVYIDYHDQWGFRHKESLGVSVDDKGRIPEAAKEIQKRIDAEIAFGVRAYKVPKTSMTLTQLLAEFKEHVGCTRKESTKYLYTLAMNTLVERLGDIPVAAFDKERYINFREWIVRKQGKQNASRCIRSLSPIMGYAEEEGYLSRNPINKRTTVTAPPVRPVVFSDQELDMFFAYLRERKKHLAILQLLYLRFTGFRSNESCVAKWEDVDFNEDVIWHYDDKLEEWVPFPMDPDLRSFMRSIPHDQKGGHIFHYRSKNSLDDLMRECKLHYIKNGTPINPKLKIHSLKKNYIRDLIKAKLPEMDVHKLSHHKSIATTHKYYATFDVDALRKSLKKSRRRSVA